MVQTLYPEMHSTYNNDDKSTVTFFKPGKFKEQLLGVETAPGKTGSMYTCKDISGSNVERRARVYRCNNR
jgi:hypothetical protein